jgi:Putative zinc-finger
MSPRRHVDALFTAAHDDDLSPIDEARFHAHIRSCKDCAAAFAEFTATVEALRELPKARMARVVHLPSTPPVAERSARPQISLGWLNAGLLRRFPATAVAGAVAAGLIIFALVHNGSGIPSTAGIPSSARSASGSGSQPVAGPAGGGAQDATCVPAIASIAESSPPAGFTPAKVATDVGLPGTRLVLATSSLSVKAGQSVVVYAQLSLPVASIGIPGTTGVPQARRTVRPCVSVAVAGTGFQLGTEAGTAYPQVLTPGPASPATLHGPVETAPLIAFTVPPGLAAGTELNVIASIPAGFEGPGTPALTATLTLTTH